MFLPIISPSKNNPYYIAREYGGYNRYTLIINKETGAVIPNCTAFCFGAFMECCGITACNLPVSNAGNWYRLAPYTKGKTPALGAIACWSGGTNGNGHVAFVNEIKSDGTIVVAESGYYSQIWFMETTIQPPYDRAGLTFQGFIYNPFVDIKTVHITEGKQRYDFMGNEIIVLGQRETWRVGMISAAGKDPHTALQDITAMDDTNIILMGKINANYYQMKEGEPDPYGEHYGTEYSFTNEFAPHKGNVLAYALMKNGRGMCVPDNGFYVDKSQTEFACAPAYVPYINGERVDLWSDAFKGSKGTKTQQTMFIRTTERCAFAVCTGKLTVAQLTDWAGNNVDGLQDLCFMDSGGSTQMVIGYDAVVYTGRLLPNALCFYVPKEAQEDAPPEEGTTDPTEELRAENEALRAENANLADRLKRIAAIINEGGTV